MNDPILNVLSKNSHQDHVLTVIQVPLTEELTVREGECNTRGERREAGRKGKHKQYNATLLNGINILLYTFWIQRKKRKKK